MPPDPADPDFNGSGPDPLECSWIRRQARRFLNPRLRRGMDSTDLVNSVLLKEEQARSRNGSMFPNQQARRGWIATALRNLVVSEARRRRPIDWEDSFFDLPGSENSPSKNVREIEDYCNARKRLRVLSERDRAVVELRVVEEESFERVGARLGITETSARVIFHRSLKKLRSSADDLTADR
ncbi:MAG: RNA polymerase sigma-70 factor (ECF subfamily) [Planctomycetota bacterium]|jgi:RNA polymerase sigma-70 factor (ECF subfamily)